jgi:hypothetical protein
MRLLQRLDAAQRPPFSCQVPVIEQLGFVESVPLEHEVEGAPGELSLDEAIGDTHGDLEAAYTAWKCGGA